MHTKIVTGWFLNIHLPIYLLHRLLLQLYALMPEKQNSISELIITEMMLEPELLVPS